jgi:hypothetical protein
MFEPDKPITEGLDFFARMDLREDWIALIDRYNDCWNWFRTYTFVGDVHPEGANRVFAIWMNELNRVIYGRFYYKKGLGIFVIRCEEMQKRGVLHYHALIAGVPEIVRYTAFALMWQRRVGRCDIQPFDVKRSGASYLSKYVSTHADLEVLGNTSLFGIHRRLA